MTSAINLEFQMAQLTEQVFSMIEKSKGLEPGTVEIDSTFAELGMDSLDGVRLLYTLENQFGLDIPDNEVYGTKTVRQAIEKLEKHLLTRPN